MNTAFESGFEAYKIYVALKAHFNRKKYDYFKYDGKTNVTEEAFRKRKDRMFFVRLSKNIPLDSLSDFFLANLLLDKETWIGEIHSTQRKKFYSNWKMKLENIEQMFDADTEALMMRLVTNEIHFNSLFLVPYGKQPIILQMLLHDQMELETFIIMNKLISFFDHFNTDLKGNPVWEDVEMKCTKYEPFLLEAHDGPIVSYGTFRNILVPKVKRLNLLPYHSGEQDE